MIRRYIIWRNNHAYAERLRRIVDRGYVAVAALARSASSSAEVAIHAATATGPARPWSLRAAYAVASTAQPPHSTMVKPRPRGTGRQGQAASSVAAAQRWRPGTPIMIVPELADRHRRYRTTIPDTSQTAGQRADKHSYQLIEPERGVFILSRPPDQPGSMRRASPDQLVSHKSDCRTNPHQSSGAARSRAAWEQGFQI